jgi:hypothetical protein
VQHTPTPPAALTGTKPPSTNPFDRRK